MCEVREAHQAGHLAYIQKRLNITAAQQDAWNRFTAKMAVANEPVNALCTSLASQPRPTTLPQKLDRAEQMINARNTQFGAMKVAAVELYGQLTSDQQAIADKCSPVARRTGRPPRRSPPRLSLKVHDYRRRGLAPRR